MPRYRTPKERAKIALVLSTLLVTAAFIIGPKSAFSLLVLSLGTVAEISVTGNIGETFVGAVIRFLASIPTWFMPVFVVLTFTNPRRKSDAGKAPNQ